MARLGSRHGAPTLPDAVTVLAATRLTADVDPRAMRGSGKVRSVHRAAIYVDLAPADEQMTIAIDAVGGLPGGMLVDASDLRSLGVRAGMTVLPSTTGWLVPSARLAFETAGARLWQPTLPDTARLNVDPATSLRIALARDIAA